MNILKRNKPECFGNHIKLSTECNSCNVKCKCLDYINKRSSGTFLIPTDKPIPKPPSLTSKEPPGAKWTLEKAKEDYNKSNPNCRKCEFSSKKEYDTGTCIVEQHIFCNVKEIQIINDCANKCKYYTTK